jgi:hypothetical protein
MQQVRGGNSPPIHFEIGKFYNQKFQQPNINQHMKNNYINRRTRPLSLFAWLLFAVLAMSNLPSFGQANVILNGTSAGNTSTSEGSAGSPYNYFWESRHMQFLYTAAEITAAGGIAGDIERLAWNVTALIGGNLTGYNIKMKNTAATVVATPMDGTGLTTVYTAASLGAAQIPAVGYNDLTWGPGVFTWDGTSNLLIDVCWGVNGGYTSSGQVALYNSTANCRGGNTSSTANRCAVQTRSAASTSKPVVRLYMAVNACLAPSSLGATVTGTSANLTWAAGAGAGTYEIWYGASPLAVPTGATTPTFTGITGLNYGVSGMTALGNYTYWIRTNCGGGTFSSWAGPYNYQAGCSGTSCTYQFTVSDGYGDGWNGARIEVRQDGILTNSITAPASGTAPLVVPVNICTGANVTFTFYGGSYNGETTCNIQDPFGTVLFNWVGNSGGTGSGYPGAPSIGTGSTVFSTFTPTCLPPACASPGTPTVSSAGPTTATASWTAAAGPPASGYDIYVSSTSTPAPIGTTTPTFNNNASTTSPAIPCASGATIYVWVRSDCSPATSNWVGPVAFTQPPANNLCGNATPIACGNQLTGSSVAADATGAGPTCSTAPGSAGVWYSWTGDGSDVSLTTCNGISDFDTKILVYSGACGALVCVAGNDDDGACGTLSTVSFTSVLGTNYKINITGYLAAAGNFRLDMTCIAPAPPPANDDCAAAISISQLPICSPTAGTTLGGTPSGIATPSCVTNAGDDDVFYSFVATTTTANVQVQSGATFNAVLQVLDGCAGAQLGCANATANGGQENVLLTGLTVGNTYIIRIYSNNTGNAAQGTFTVCVFNGIDPCSSITAITCNSVNAYNVSGGGIWSITDCWFGGTPGAEKLYSFTPAITGNYQINVTGATGGYVDYLFKPAASGCNATGWNCILDINTAGYYEFGPLTAGTPYYFLLDGEGTTATNQTWALICPPANDNCGLATATSLTHSIGCTPVSGNTQAANPSAVGAVSGNLSPESDYPDVWYKFVATSANAKILVDASSLLAAGVELYSACGSPTTICYDYAQAQGEDVELVINTLIAGNTYYIRVVDLLSGSLGVYYSTYYFTICVSTPPVTGPNCVVPPPSANDENEICGANSNGGCPNPGADIIMTTGTISTSLANFYDSGGVAGDYSSGESNTLTISPTTPGNKIRVTFTTFDIESSWDGLFIHNGATTGSPLFASANGAGSGCPGTAGAWWGTTPPGTFTSTAGGGELTFNFCSDASFSYGGWSALIEEVTAGGVPINAGAYEPYTIGDFVKGRVFASCGSRDLDWFEFNVTQVSAVSFNVSAEFPVTAFILNSDCPSTVKAFNSTTIECAQAQATTVLQPGTYRLAVAPNTFNGIPCSSTRNEYFFQLLLALPPVNDDCANATTLPVGVPGTCPANKRVGTTLAALEEPSLADPTCNTGNISDVWYTFFSGSATELELTASLNSATEIGIQLFSSCGVAIGGSCVNNITSLSPYTLTVTPNTTYKLRVFTNYDVQNPGTFELCLQYKPLPPVNDNICGALPLTMVTSAAYNVSADNFYATQSPQAAMTCQSSHSRDIWYKVTVPASGVVTINTNYGTNVDLVGAIYTSSDNTCTGTLTQVACDDDRGPDNAVWMQGNGLTPGATVFVRIAGFGAFPASTNKGTFSLSASNGLVWTGASSNSFNTISDPDLGIPTNWFSYDGGSYGPNNLDNPAVSIAIPIGLPNQPNVTSSVSCNSIYALGNSFSTGGITVQTGTTLSVHGSVYSNGLAQPRLNGGGIYRFNSSSATTHTIGNNTRVNSNVTVAPTSTVAAGGKLIFLDNSSLFSDSPAATYGPVTGNIVYRRTGNLSNYAYNYWSSPVVGATISSISIIGGTPNTYQYNTTLSPGLAYADNQLGWEAVGPGVTMTAARGYIATGAGSSSFTGVPNQSDASYSPLTGGGGNTWNLIGNPFPAQTNAATFLSQNSGKITGGSIYIWDDDASGGVDYSTGDYIITNGAVTINGPNSGNPFSGSIASCQGFFVNWVGGSGNINFNRTARIPVGTNAEFFEATEYARLKLKIENAVTQTSETALIFPSDATEEIDIAYDAYRLAGNPNLGMYTFIGAQEFVIQGLPTLSSQQIIPLGVVNNTAGTASISLSQFEYFDAGVFVYLEDLQEGLFHNLSAGPYVYTNVASNVNNNRFRLHLRAPLAVSATAACAGQASGKMLINNPNDAAVVVNLKDSQDNIVATTGSFIGERVIENLVSDSYTLDFSYENGDNASKQVSISSGSIVAPASFVSSSTSVTIEDAIIEFIGSAAGANQFEWSFGDGTSVSNDLNPVHAYMAPGVYTVTFTASNGGCQTVATTTINVSASVTGINNVNDANGFTIYPNPANESASLLLNLDRSENKVVVSIHDAAGRLVNSHNVKNVRAGSIVELDIDGLANGVYQVTVEGNSFKNVGRLTISK